ncbi:MAG TPA: redoxin domain-containing protein [Thermoanaerobaculia bacterium]|jgi:thiol-disulfide isomerase/thioredoxin|nr:redoxin domain-containing protein [Thermoanaerobaculia bacterium]
MRRLLLLLSLVIVLPLHAADLVRGVRSKISAGDLATGIAQAEDYKRAAGVDAEYLDAIGWLARGAQLLGQPERARMYIAELRRELPEEKAGFITPYGAAIEVEGRLLAATDGRGAAIRYFEEQLARAKAPELRSRISKNINMLALEGQPAPAVETISLSSMRGKPVLLFFFAEGCGDCKGQAPSLGRVWEKYRGRVGLVAVTRLYGGPSDKPLTPAEEKAQIEKVWKETYAPMADVPVVVSTESMVRWGASATPTFALLDRRGIVRLYTPTRLSEAELSRRIDELLAEVVPGT